jgi:hypothetical protein
MIANQIYIGLNNLHVTDWKVDGQSVFILVLVATIRPASTHVTQSHVVSSANPATALPEMKKATLTKIAGQI